MRLITFTYNTSHVPCTDISAETYFVPRREIGTQEFSITDVIQTATK